MSKHSHPRRDHVTQLRDLMPSAGSGGARASFESHDGEKALEISPDGERSRSDSLTGSAHGSRPVVRLIMPSVMTSAAVDGEAGEEKHLGLIGAVALVVGTQLGSGIFSSPGVIFASTKSIGASLLIWVLGGILAWTGASSYAELGSAIPVDGGSQAYLGYAYGPLASYLYTFTTVVAIKPGSAAIIALIFGEYAARLVYILLPPSLSEVDPSVSASTAAAAPLDIPIWLIKSLACGAIVGTSLLSALNAKSGIKAAVALTSIKVASLVFVLVLGVFSLLKNGVGPNFRDVGLWDSTSGSPAAFAVALYSGLWAYDGWDNSNLVAGQMINAARDLPRCIHISLSSMILLYVLTNLAYFVVLPLDIVGVTNTIALDFGHMVIGRAGGLVFTVVVGTSCFGALNNGVYTAARLIYAASREEFLPSLFGSLSPSRQTPINAIGLNMLLCLIFVILGGGFRSMVSFFGVISWVFYLATVSGLLYLRVKEPNLARPYRTWLITPVTFCGVALFLLMMPAIAAPLQALAAFAFIVAGLPAYHMTMRYKGGPARDVQEYHPLSTMARITSLPPLTQIALFALIARMASCVFLVGLPRVFGIGAFDSSAGLFSPGTTSTAQAGSPWWQPFLRWDGLYFADIAQHGYRFEQGLAFFPAWPAIMRIAGEAVATSRQLLGGSTRLASVGDIVVGATVLSNVCFVFSSIMLYRCSLAAGLDRARSYRAALLYVLAPAPAVMSSPYTEQLFALCSFTGYWLLQRRSTWPRTAQAAGSMVLAVGGGTRSLGVMGTVVVMWVVLVKPFVRAGRHVPRHLFHLTWCGLLCVLVVAPFLAFQALAYRALCKAGGTGEIRDWCHTAMPLAYSAVQEKYWNIGFLRYWEAAQIPNFLLAGPVLAICVFAIGRQAPCGHAAIRDLLRAVTTQRCDRIERELDIFPHYTIHVVTTFVLILSSHTQIALRVCSGMPIVWWALAEVCFEREEMGDELWTEGEGGGGTIQDRGPDAKLTRVGRAWVTWICVWGCVSLVLWSGFLPPA